MKFYLPQSRGLEATAKELMAKRDFVQSKGLFVTGTDTGVGKTVIAGTIAHALAKKGYKAGVFKPISTGCRWVREGLVSSDAEFLAHCSGCPCPLEQINPVRYHPPLAPYAAAERTGEPINWQEMQLSYSNVVQSSDAVIVEGIGGLMVPLERDYFVVDLIADMAMPALIVARAGLGTINHTLLSLEACRSRGISVAGVVLNGYQADQADLAEETNPRIITEIGKPGLLTVIPYDNETCVEKGRLGSKISQAASMVNWAEIVKSIRKKV